MYLVLNIVFCHEEERKKRIYRKIGLPFERWNGKRRDQPKTVEGNSKRRRRGKINFNGELYNHARSTILPPFRKKSHWTKTFVTQNQSIFN